MNFAGHVSGFFLVLVGLLAPVPLATVLAGASQVAGPGLRLVALLSWWMALGMGVVLGLGWCGVLWFGPLLTLLVTLGVVGLCALRWARGSRERVYADAWQAWNHWQTAVTAERIAVAVTAAVAVVWLIALTVVPSDNYDSHMYQLPTVAEWLQHGSVNARSEQWRNAPSYERSMFYYPGGWNAWYAVALSLGGHERWAFLPNLLAWALFGASVRALARLAGAASLPATLAAALVLALPVTGVALASAHNDLALGGVWLATVVAAVLAARSREPCWLALAVVLAGMAIGIKPNGLGAAVCAAVAFIAVRYWSRSAVMPASAGSVPRLHPAFSWLLFAIPLAMLIAVPWYIRNDLETGNPLGFLRMQILGLDFPGTIDAAYIAQTTLLHNFHITDRHHWGWLGAALGVYLGLAWIGLLLPLWTWNRCRSRPAFGLVLLAMVLAWAWIAGPWSAKHAHDETLSFWMGQQLRYTFALWGVVAALAAVVSRSIPWLWNTQVLLLWISVLATIWITPMRPVAPWLMGAVTVIFAVLILRGIRPWRRWLPLVMLLALLVLPWCLRNWRQGLRNWYYFGAPSALASLDKDRPVAFWATHQAWLLYGDELQRKPVFLPLDSVDTDEELIDLVRACGCDHLAIGETWPPTPPVMIDRLIALGVVEPMHGEPHAWGMKIFRILRP